MSSSSSLETCVAPLEVMELSKDAQQAAGDEQQQDLPLHDPEKCLCALIVESGSVKGEDNVELEEKEDQFRMREEELRVEYEDRMASEIDELKARFELILLNEQVRTSCLLREAQWQKQEKISALQTQLESKNLATLMHLLCSERKKNRHEIKHIIEEYTQHINRLTDMIKEGQTLMEQTIRGYKTASKVNAEWRVKTQAIVKEFQMFIEHYFGTVPDSSKFFFNMPELLKICSPLYPDDAPRDTDTCPFQEYEAGPENECKIEDNWWAQMNGPNKPFVVFGDMEYFHPTQRRELLKKIKNDKTPPPEKWMKYGGRSLRYITSFHVV